MNHVRLVIVALLLSAVAGASDDGKTKSVPMVTMSLSRAMCNDDASRAVVYRLTESAYKKTAAKMGWGGSPYDVKVGQGLFVCHAYAYARKSD